MENKTTSNKQKDDILFALQLEQQTNKISQSKITSKITQKPQVESVNKTDLQSRKSVDYVMIYPALKPDEVKLTITEDAIF